MYKFNLYILKAHPVSDSDTLSNQSQSNREMEALTAPRASPAAR